jgi:ABC-type transporter Mla subunit MlaD
VFPRAIRTLDRAQPVFEDVRGYTPDLASWLSNFGQLAASYDANGHYARVHPMFLPASYSETGGLLTAHEPSQKLDGFQKGANNRCPGGNVQPPPDGSAALADRRVRHVLDAARPMRRLVYICLFVAIAPWIAIGIAREASDDDTQDHYYVRAIFDNAANLVEGEDVKVAGVPVGAIERLDVTEDQKAALTLRIDNEDFIPWKADAGCTIRPQSLIGEKFVECEPGSAGEEPLQAIDAGPGEGERLLPVENTSSPVDLDLINNILRLPYRERFRILLSEFGTGLAGRGEELNEVIHRANPALRETDRVLAILADQNRVLARLARDSDTALAPLARERSRVSHWVVEANRTGQASAERSADLRRGINRLPAFLRELRPLMADLETLADQGTPLLADLKAAAPDMDRLIRGLGTVSEAGRESFPSLGDALERGRPALIRARPLIRDLGRLGREAGPATESLDELTASLEETGGIERINDFLYYLALNTNGFDAVGHYLRAGLVTNTCSSYFTEPAGGCNSNFYDPFSGPASASLGARNAEFDERTAGEEGSVAPQGTLLGGLLGGEQDPSQTRQREEGLERLRRRAEGQSPALGPEEPVLDYLLGGEE